MNPSWLFRRTLGLDARLLFHQSDLGLARKVELLLRKYSTLAKHIVKPFRLGRDRTRLFGRPLYYNTRFGLVDLQRMLVTYGEWLRECPLQAQCTVVDVGANVGMFVEFVRAMYPQSSIHCFEPVPSTFECLQRNTNGLPDVRVHNVALGDAPGRARMRFDPSASILSTVAEDGNVEVRIDTLDDYVRRNNIDTIELLKIDTEGYEASVLRGAAAALKRTRYLLIEAQIEKEQRYTFSSLLGQLSTDEYEFQLRFYRNFVDQMEGEIPAADLFMENVRFARRDEIASGR